ncbi:MAG: hypothetical protein K0S07_1669 [Chlamydiales bacterium]|nr:hypothetical protein [Chlamydiales bacterium]
MDLFANNKRIDEKTRFHAGVFDQFLHLLLKLPAGFIFERGKGQNAFCKEARGLLKEEPFGRGIY